MRSLILALLLISAPAAASDLCGSGKRIDCVVDGDTVWIAGEKIRLQGIDAPEMRGSCPDERRRAALAAERLRQMLAGAAPVVIRSGLDRYGRTLATINVAGRDLGKELVAEGLARVWAGRRERWCGR